MTPLPFPSPRPARVAVLGVGNDLKADDGVGVCVARRLRDRMPPDTQGVLVVDAGTAPENFTGPLRRFRPDLVIEVDAADHGEPAGTAAWLDWHDADGMSASTHTLPPSVLAGFLSAELGCRVALLGVQPASLEIGQPLSPVIDAAADSLVAALLAWLTGESPARGLR